jgi:hemolysin-activating ACP:hemolysin acyltransferase
MPLAGKLEISIRVIYHGVSDNNKIITGDKEMRPITFHTWAFTSLDGQFRVYRRRCQDPSSLEAEEWETFYDHGYRHYFWDNLDKLINVFENPGQFPTL